MEWRTKDSEAAAAASVAVAAAAVDDDSSDAQHVDDADEVPENSGDLCLSDWYWTAFESLRLCTND